LKVVINNVSLDVWPISNTYRRFILKHLSTSSKISLSYVDIRNGNFPNTSLEIYTILCTLLSPNTAVLLEVYSLGCVCLPGIWTSIPCISTCLIS